MSSLATFEESQFHWAAGFSDASFEHHADFRKTEFVTAAVFDYAKFGGRIQFNGSKCGLQMKLDHAVFNYRVPEFFEAELPEAIEFHGAVWPEPPKHDSEAAQLHTYAYQRLKAEMERLKRHEDEQYFFAKEMRSKRVLLRYRVLEGGWGLGDRLGDLAVIGADTAYDFFTSYGRSIGKPIFWLFLLFAFGTVAFAQISSLTSGSAEWCDAAGLSATNLFSFLPYKPSKLLAEYLTPTGKIIGDIQSLFGLILLFLLGLGLRNRFRMK